MISLTVQPATHPRDQVFGVLSEVFDRVLDTLDAQALPPDLGEATGRVHRFQRQDSVTRLDEALQDQAHAAIAALVVLRARVDPRVTGR